MARDYLIIPPGNELPYEFILFLKRLGNMNLAGNLWESFCLARYFSIQVTFK
jgi:hypothetical protein